MCVFNHHNGIIYYNTQPEQEREQYNHVHGEAHPWQYNECDEHRQRHRHRNENRVGRSHEEHENNRYENETNDDRVDQIMREEKWDTRLIGQIHDDIVKDIQTCFDDINELKEDLEEDDDDDYDNDLEIRVHKLEHENKDLRKELKTSMNGLVSLLNIVGKNQIVSGLNDTQG